VTLGVPPSELAPVLELLVRGGSLVRVKDLLFHKPSVDALGTRLVAHLQMHGQIDAQGWKELVGASRKFSIPLAEHFDAERVTLRVGDSRKLRNPPDQKR
jgi:selenocysteine-specific elongation factor